MSHIKVRYGIAGLYFKLILLYPLPLEWSVLLYGYRGEKKALLDGLP